MYLHRMCCLMQTLTRSRSLCFIQTSQDTTISTCKHFQQWIVKCVLVGQGCRSFHCENPLLFLTGTTAVTMHSSSRLERNSLEVRYRCSCQLRWVKGMQSCLTLQHISGYFLLVASLLSKTSTSMQQLV